MSKPTIYKFFKEFTNHRKESKKMVVFGLRPHPKILKHMTVVFHTRPYGRFMEIKSYVGRKKLNRTYQDSNFLEDVFRNGDNIRTPIQFRRERKS